MNDEELQAWLQSVIEPFGCPGFKEALQALVDVLIANGVTESHIEAIEIIGDAVEGAIVYSIRNRKMSYERYLQTRHWQRMRQFALESAGYRCQLCNSPKRLETHHRTYERIGREDLTDLIVLCRDCHSKFHDKLP